MSSFKPFFHHFSVGPGKLPNRTPRGFSLYIRPLFPQEIREEAVKRNMDRDLVDRRMCAISGTFCSPKDQFSKKEGRIRAEAAAIKIINKRDLPRMVAACYIACDAWEPEELEHITSDFQYLLRYVI